jgi:Carboxypeptidase regulatory-like domain
VLSKHVRKAMSNDSSPPRRARPTDDAGAAVTQRLLVVTLVMVAAVAALTAQGAASGTIGGRGTDVTEGVLPGVKVTAVGGTVRREAMTAADGRYEIADLPPGTYTVTTEMPGFMRRQAAVEVRAGRRATFDFRLRVGCLDEVQKVHFPFDEMLSAVDAIAYVRILEAGPPQELILKDVCYSVRPYLAEPLHLINVSPERRDASRLRFFAAKWDQPLAPGEEVITFLQKAPRGVYREVDAEYRLLVRDGRIDLRRTDTTRIASGDAVADVLKALRKGM